MPFPIGSAQPPLWATDKLVVFGTPTKVDWYLMSAVAARDIKGNTLQSQVSKFITGSRGLDPEEDTTAPQAWTSTFLSVRPVADPARWADADRNNPNVCVERYKRYKRMGCP